MDNITSIDIQTPEKKQKSLPIGSEPDDWIST